MNAVQLVGRLTRDPELKQVEVGDETRPVCQMRIAVNNGRDDKAMFIDVVTWNRQAEVCAEYLTSGRLIGVSGRLDYQEWTSDDSKHSKHQVVGRVEFLDSKPSDGAKDNGEHVDTAEAVAVAAGAVGDEDIPF